MVGWDLGFPLGEDGIQCTSAFGDVEMESEALSVVSF